MTVLTIVARCVLVTLMLGVSALAQERPRRVLILYDEDRTLPGLSILDRSLRTSLSAGLGADIEFFTESMSLSQFNDEHYEQVLREHYARKYRDKKLDLVVGVMGPALAFLVRHGDAVFPGVPVVFCGADAADIRNLTLPSRFTGLLVRRVFAPTVDVVLRLQPETRHIVVVGGTSAFDQHLLTQAKREFQAFEARLSFEYLTDLPMADLLTAVSHVPSQSVILFVTLFRDGAGRAYIPHEVVSRVAGAANAAVYVFVDQYLGRGAVGGHLYSLERHGNQAAELGVRVLRGESPSAIPVREAQSTANMFDARQLAKWRLDEGRLPPGSIVEFRESSFWREYRVEILAVVAGLIIQSVLIVGLLYQRRARRRAELESLRNFSMAADASRQATMSALTGSIAHELSQPMNAIQHNAEAGEMLLKANRADSETLGAILTDIRNANVRATQIVERHRSMLRNRRLDKKPTDIHAVVRESLALVAHATEAKNARVDVELPSAPCLVRGDQVLLQQVIVNLLMNGLEAMADTPADRRRLTIRGEITAGTVSVSIRDAGTGLPPPADGRVFEPFVTTKANGIGIGLTIVRTIVDAHDGTLDARNNHDGGATFKLTLPRTGGA